MRNEKLLKEYEHNYYNYDMLKEFLNNNKDFRVPCYYDSTFKKLFSYKEFMSVFLSHFIPLDKDEIKRQLEYHNTENERINNFHKGSITDIKIWLDDYVIIFECNKEKRKAIIDKNMHTFRGTCYEAVEKGRKEGYCRECILISLDNYDYYHQDKIETEGKYLDVETKIQLVENETIYFINLEKVRKELYNINNLAKLNTFEKLLMFIVSCSKEESNMIVEGDEELEMISNEMNRFSTTTDEILIRSDEFLKQGLYREGRDEGMTIGRDEGIAIGRSEGMSIGQNKANLLTALNMIKDGLSNEKIKLYTNLNIDEINNLRVNNN